MLAFVLELFQLEHWSMRPFWNSGRLTKFSSGQGVHDSNQGPEPYFTGSELKAWFTCLTIVGFKFVRMHKTYFWCQLWMHDACQIRSRIVIKRSPTVNIHPDHPLGRDNDIKPKDDFQIKKFPIMIFAKPGKPAFKYIYGFLSERRGYFRDL